MGIKGEEVGGGFPQPKPAFIVLLNWDPEDVHALGPTTHPKNQLTYIKFQGSLKPVQGSGLPHVEAVVVDGMGLGQEEHLPSGDAWVKAEATTLLRVIEPSGSSEDPETETGLIRLTWTTVGIVPRLQDILKKDRDLEEKIIKVPQQALPQGASVGSISFTTGDPRYKFLEHAVYIGRYRLLVTPPEGPEERPRYFAEYKFSHVAA